ncbi:hypothetical protein, partial [Paraburkholderia sp.]|uniref:hypothetical protein n=1 Tax=Paraburkholderia sp. TaxID=1926495 RepID=UPI0039E5F8C2
MCAIAMGFGVRQHAPQKRRNKATSVPGNPPRAGKVTPASRTHHARRGASPRAVVLDWRLVALRVKYRAFQAARAFGEPFKGRRQAPPGGRRAARGGHRVDAARDR